MSGSPMASGPVEGVTAPGFEPVAEEFGRLLARDGDARGQFCAYSRGQRVADLYGGDGVTVRVALSHQAGYPGRGAAAHAGGRKSLDVLTARMG
jgi:hypothetical protein